MGSFRNVGVPYFGVLIIRILLFGALIGNYLGPSITPEPSVRAQNESYNFPGWHLKAAPTKYS